MAKTEETKQPMQSKGKLHPTSAATGEEKWWKMFVPTKRLFFTPLLMDVNIILFLLMVISSQNAANTLFPDTDTVLAWGASTRSLTVGEHQWWRTLTSNFEHIGILHLMMNMYALFHIGQALEPLLGKARFIAAYIASAIFASLTSLYWHDNMVSAGASGAIFGLYGLLLALLTGKMIRIEKRNVLIVSIAVFVVFTTVFDFRSRIDMAAPLGGLISGLIIGYLYYFLSRGLKNKKRNSIVAGSLAAIALLAMFIVPQRLNDVYAEYNKQILQFSRYENQALTVFNLPKDASDAKRMSALKEDALPNWRNCKMTLDKLHTINLPEELRKRKSLLDKYVDVRIRICNTSINAIGDTTHKYESELEKLNRELNGIMQEIRKSS